MNSEIKNELEDAYFKLNKDIEIQSRSYNYKGGFIVLILTIIYYYYSYWWIIMLIGLQIISILANIYKLFGYREGFKNGYLDVKGFDIDDYNLEN